MPVCRGCSSEFPPGHPNRRYCSEPCRQVHKNQSRTLNMSDAERTVRREREARRLREDGDRVRARRRERGRIPEVAEARRATTRRSYRRHRQRRIQDSVIWQRQNPEKVAMRYARRKARERGYAVTPRDLRRQVQRQYGLCAYCSVPLSAPGRTRPTSLQWDHVVPLSRGGSHSAGNLVASCRDCNLTKGSKFVIEFRTERLEAE